MINCLKYYPGLNSHEIKVNWPSLHKILRRERLSLSLRTTKQSTIKNYFYKYLRMVRERVKVVTVDMSASYIPIIKQLFPNAQIVLDRFHIIQHLGRAMMSTRVAIMKRFDIKSLPYRAMKNHWRILHKDSPRFSDKAFYSRTFR